MKVLLFSLRHEDFETDPKNGTKNHHNFDNFRIFSNLSLRCYWGNQKMLRNNFFHETISTAVYWQIIQNHVFYKNNLVLEQILE